MASLLENVKKGLQSAPASPQQLGAQDQVQALSRAATGKAVGSGSAPQLSQEGVAQAAQQTQLQQRQLQMQGQQAAQQLGAAEQQQNIQIRQQQKKMSQAEVAQKEQAYQKLGSMLDQFSQKWQELDLNKNKAQVEQAGFLLRLNSDKYTTKLQVEGKKARLQNEVNFTEALQRAIFKEERSLMESNLAFQSLIRATGRDFDAQLETMKLEDALALGDMETASKNEQAKWEGISQIVSGVTSATGSVASHYDFKNNKWGGGNS